MQLRRVKVREIDKEVVVQISAPLPEWITLIGLIWEEFHQVHDGDIFQLIKWMNEAVRKG